MARIHGKDLSLLNVDNAAGTAADFKADTMSLDFSVSAETHDTTTIGDQWREFTSGLKGGDEFRMRFCTTTPTPRASGPCTRVASG
jgi:hypothetical protein